MFTGIIEKTAIVAKFNPTHDGYRLKVTADTDSTPDQNLQIGASISINGVCLTVVEFNDNWICFDIIQETLQRTTLAELQTNDEVNFERSLKFGDEIGGHIVSGHIWCTAQVIQAKQSNYLFKLADATAMKYIFEKGFVAINGASLTIGKVDAAGFWIHLIPETQAITNLKHLAVGTKVNIELESQTVTIVDSIERIQSEKQNIIQH